MRKKISISPEEGFWNYNDDLVHKMSIFVLDEKILPGIGKSVKLNTAEDEPDLFGKIIDFDENQITVDCNQPLVGKTLNYKIKVIGIYKPGKRARRSDSQCC